MDSVGIDLHHRRSHVVVIDEDGTDVLTQRIHNGPETFLELLAERDARLAETTATVHSPRLPENAV
jgi:hypothetical protein